MKKFTIDLNWLQPNAFIENGVDELPVWVKRRDNLKGDGTCSIGRKNGKLVGLVETDVEVSDDLYILYMTPEGNPDSFVMALFFVDHFEGIEQNRTSLLRDILIDG